MLEINDAVKLSLKLPLKVCLFDFEVETLEYNWTVFSIDRLIG